MKTKDTPGEATFTCTFTVHVLVCITIKFQNTKKAPKTHVHVVHINIYCTQRNSQRMIVKAENSLRQRFGVRNYSPCGG